MNRVDKYKLGYIIALAILGAGAMLAIQLLGGGGPSMLIVAGILFIPGRIQGFVYRSLFRGRRLLDSGQYSDALCCFERFLQCIRKEPWRKAFIWLSWTVYTPDVEAMAMNNIGTSKMLMGNMAEAQDAFDEALLLDAEYPLPFFNSALLDVMQENMESAKKKLAMAEELGYKRSTIDVAVRKAQSLLAGIEGRGSAQT